MFHVTVKTNDESCTLSAGASESGNYDRPSLTFFRDQPLAGGSDGALRSLVAQFESFAGRFAGNGTPEGSLNLGSLVGEAQPVLWRRGLFIHLHDEAGNELPFRSESVIVLEVILSLGDELASHSTDAGLVDAWNELRAKCDLLPMPRETSFDEPRLHQTLSEAQWYASKLGQDLNHYVETSKWLRARQFLYAFGRMQAEPTREEYRIDVILDLPSLEDIDGLVAEAAEGADQTVENFITDAVFDRNFSARQEVVFRRWYGPVRRKDSTAPNP
jgi:hypothetical protein